MIDFHCHIDLYPQPKIVIDRVIREGIYVLAVTTTPLAWRGTNELVMGVPRVRVAAGLHPELVAERQSEVEALCHLMDETQYVGEVGLDGSPKCRGSFAKQQQVFRRVLAVCAEKGGRILSIHSRGAASAVLDALEACPEAGTPVLHWFSGTKRELSRAIALGCWFSVGPTMLASAKGCALARAMPPDRVLTETDGPFANRQGNPLMPWDVLDSIAQLAPVWAISPADAAVQVTTNFRRLLGVQSGLQGMTECELSRNCNVRLDERF